MGLIFKDISTGESIGSNQLVRNVLVAATRQVDPSLSEKIRSVKNWRKNYQNIYSSLTRSEFYSDQNVLEIASKGLELLAKSICDERGRDLDQIIQDGWVCDSQVETFYISGTQPARALQIEGIASLTDAAQIWSQEEIVEKGLINSFKFLDAHKKLPIAMDVLIALAGAAEYAPTKNWLALGGTVAVAARPGRERWLEMIASARNSGGTLIIPVLKKNVTESAISLSDEAIAENAGLDICDDLEALAGWIAALSVTRSERMVLGQYAYAPGDQHICVQAAQDSLAAAMCNRLPASRVALAWLATPTDSTAVPAAVLDESFSRYRARSKAIKVRDFILGLRKPDREYFETQFGEKLALIDSTLTVQGSSYAFAKRAQRWRAYLSNSQGVKVSYVVAPPARTKSVLNFRIFRAAYRGAPQLGVQPFSVKVATAATTALLVRDLHGTMTQRGATALHTESAIHGGLWRLIYRPSQVWTRATLLGWPGLLVAD